MLWARSSTCRWTWKRFMASPGSTGGAARCRGDVADGAMAAVGGEVGEQGVHLLDGWAIDQVAAVALLRYQAGMHQFLQMEGQGGTRHAQRRAQRAWGH